MACGATRGGHRSRREPCRRRRRAPRTTCPGTCARAQTRPAPRRTHDAVLPRPLLEHLLPPAERAGAAAPCCSRCRRRGRGGRRERRWGPPGQGVRRRWGGRRKWREGAAGAGELRQRCPGEVRRRWIWSVRERAPRLARLHSAADHACDAEHSPPPCRPTLPRRERHRGWSRHDRRAEGPGERREEGRKERERGERGWLTSGPHCHAASTSAKPVTKTAGWPNMNDFDSSVVEDTRFWSSMAKTKPRQELDGRKWTLS
jgi:hypothetical protein